MVDYDRVVAALPAYEISSELGRGAYGVVLAGRHRQLGRLVAIKQLPYAFGADAAVRGRFISEARVLATLDHPHIVAIYDFVDYEGLCLLVMERLTGGTVWSRFHAGGFTPDVSAAILLALCAGLHHAHQHGVLHRDVKPENLMFSGEGTLKVTDLGIAKVVGGSATLATRAGEVLGTPAYIAPEQARGGELTPATDVYQAGTLLYELLAGRLPFPADSDAATTLYRHVHELPPPLLEVAHHVPAELASVTDRAIATSARDRYQTAEEFGVAIAHCAARTWGRGWLARTNVPVSASGPILLAALGELDAVAKIELAPRLDSDRMRAEQSESLPSEYMPVQLVHPELGATSDASGALAEANQPAVARESHDPRRTDVQAAVAAGAGAGSAAEAQRHSSQQSPPPAATSSTPDASRPRSARRGAKASRDRRMPKPAFLIAGIVALVIVLAAAGIAVARTTGGKGHGSRSATSPPASKPAVLTSSLWRSLPRAPTARQQVAATVSQGVAWIFGGLTNGAATAKVEGYDPTISTWESGPDLPLPLHHEMAVVYHGDMVVMGGWIPSGSALDATTSPRVFALRNNAWVELPPMHHPRAAATAAVVGNDIVVAGGQADHQLVQPAEVFDGTAWHDVANIPTPRDHLSSASDGRYFYAVGGRALSADKNLGAVERYDPASNQWSQLPSLPTPRGGLGAAIIGSRLIAIGGEAPTSVLGNVESLDLGTNTWTALPSMKSPRHGMAVVAIGTTIYAIGGAGAPGHTNSVPTNEAADTASFPTLSAWRALPSPATARQQVGATVSQGVLWIFGGLTNGAATTKVEGYDPAISTWESGPDLPLPLHHESAVTYHGAMTVIGGWVPLGSVLDALATPRVFALRNNTWVELPPLHHARAAATAAVVGDKIVVAGGQADHQLVPQTEVFDGTAWHDVANIPTPRDHLAGVSDGRYFYAVGGRALSADKNLGAVERYDPVTNQWAQLPSLPTPRGGLGAAMVGTHLVTVGGEAPTAVLGNVEALDLATNSWTTLPAMKTPRHGMALIAIGATIYAIAGAASSGHTNSVTTSEATDVS